MLEQRFGERGRPMIICGKRPRRHGNPFNVIQPPYSAMAGYSPEVSEHRYGG
jgi:hypothetical protein